MKNWKKPEISPDNEWFLTYYLKDAWLEYLLCPIHIDRNMPYGTFVRIIFWCKKFIRKEFMEKKIQLQNKGREELITCSCGAPKPKVYEGKRICRHCGGIPQELMNDKELDDNLEDQPI